MEDLRIEPRTSSMLSKLSTSELYPSPPNIPVLNFTVWLCKQFTYKSVFFSLLSHVIPIFLLEVWVDLCVSKKQVTIDLVKYYCVVSLLFVPSTMCSFFLLCCPWICVIFSIYFYLLYCFFFSDIHLSPHIPLQWFL